jgi:hypothetical protein
MDDASRKTRTVAAGHRARDTAIRAVDAIDGATLFRPACKLGLEGSTIGRIAPAIDGLDKNQEPGCGG